MTTTKTMATKIETDMRVHASDKGPTAYIGRVVGVKKRYLKLSKHDTPDGKRRYIPLDWVNSVTSKMVHLARTASYARSHWLTKADLKARKAAE